jgi:putative spermidine/putrescine transport system permease protein
VARETSLPELGAAQLPAPPLWWSVGRRLVAGLAAWLPALPLLLVSLGMLAAPAVALIVQSFSAEARGFTLDNWATTLNNRGDQRAIITSLQLGAVCASLSLLLGTPVAWFISRMLPPRRAASLALLNVAANFGGIGLAFAYVALLGTYGMLTLALRDLGLPFEPPAPGSFAGLVIGYEYTDIPLFVLLTIPAMGALRHEWWEAAQTAAATRLEFWRYIGIPILAPFLGAGWLLIFTWSIGIYGLAFALAGANASGQLRLMTLQIGYTLQASFFEERAAVMAVILMLFASISLAAYRFLVRWAVRWA